jgi:hypothetical protein
LASRRRETIARYRYQPVPLFSTFRVENAAAPSHGMALNGLRAPSEPAVDRGITAYHWSSLPAS